MSTLEESRLVINRVDEEMAHLFEERMAAVRAIVDYKTKAGLPILDSSREAFLLERNCGFLESPAFLESYRTFFAAMLTISKDYQKQRMAELLAEGDM